MTKRAFIYVRPGKTALDPLCETLQKPGKTANEMLCQHIGKAKYWQSKLVFANTSLQRRFS